MEYRKIFGLLCLIMQCTKVISIGTFQLKLIRFVNDEAHDQTGYCCTNPDSKHCAGPCRTAFRVCLTHYQTTVGESCTFGSILTPVLGENSFDPVSSRYLHSRPINFNFTFRWPKSFSLVIDVLHVSANNSEQIHGHSDVIISRLVKSAETLPVEASPSTWTQPEPYVHRQSKLYYEYRVVCDDNQYGSDCGTFCRPRDDAFGHYTCDAYGDKVCLPGWTAEDNESYCTKALCTNGCEPNQGICVAPNTCSCWVGWSGDDCTQCETMRDCGHGTCDTPFQCICKTGWGGSFCNQDLNFCVNNEPCHNGATCSNAGEGSYTCTCAPGFIGPNCQIELNECDSNPCQNGAECVDMKADYKCICPRGLFGQNCDTIRLNCEDKPCMNGGTCIEGGNQHRCECPAQWKGLYCEELASECSGNLCLNNGTCHESANGITCACKSGFSGQFCERKNSHCTNLMCLNQGTCAGPSKSDGLCFCRRCFCSTEYSGSRCERISGASNDLSDLIIQESFISKKETHKSTHIVVNQTRYKNDDADMNMNSSLKHEHWILICVGLIVLVVILIASVACLFHHKRKKTLKHKQNFQKVTQKQEDSRSVDMAIIADRSSPEADVICERSFQKPVRNSKIRLSAGSFQRKSALSASLADVDRFVMSEPRSSGKSSIVANDGHCCRRYSYHFVQTVPEFVNDATETVPLRRPCSVSSSIQPHEAAPLRKVQMRRERPLDRPKSLRLSFSRPPTYEEVCREKNEFVRLQSGNGIAI